MVFYLDCFWDIDVVIFIEVGLNIVIGENGYGLIIDGMYLILEWLDLSFGMKVLYCFMLGFFENDGDLFIIFMFNIIVDDLEEWFVD